MLQLMMNGGPSRRPLPARLEATAVEDKIHIRCGKYIGAVKRVKSESV